MLREIVPSLMMLPRNSTPTPDVPEVRSGTENVHPLPIVRLPAAFLYELEPLTTLKEAVASELNSQVMVLDNLLIPAYPNVTRIVSNNIS